MRALTGWRVARQLGGIAAGWTALPAGEQPGWRTMALDTQTMLARKGARSEAPSETAAALATWYRAEFSLSRPAAGIWVPWRAVVDAAGDGLIYLNGHPLGRYWEAGPQREFYLPECWLNFGPGTGNVLTFCLSPMQGGVGLRGVEVSPYAEQAEFRDSP